MKSSRYFLSLLLLLAGLGAADASVPLGGNRKGVGGSYDMYGCMQSNDYYVVNFAAYQLGSDRAAGARNLPEAECVDIPATGKTQVTIDLLDLDLRKKPVGLKILREDGQPLVELPMAVVKQGVLSTTVDFKAPGNYRAVLTVDDTDLHTQPEISALHIPLTVALASGQSGEKNGLLVLFVIIGSLIAALAYFLPRLLKSQPLEQ